MQFSALYGTELDRELGTADRTQRFTTQRRKDAINAAQLEFVRRTECLTRSVSIALVDGTQEYDLEASISDFGWLSKQGLSISVTDGTTTRYYEGDDLIFMTVERLNAEHPGWRGWTAGTPRYYYIDRNGGALNLGFAPAPDFDGDTAAVRVHAVIVPADMSADADEPFTVSSNPIKSLRFHHRALVYYAAFDLEKLRKDSQREGLFSQLFDAEVEKYFASMKPKGGQQVRMARNYRTEAIRGVGRAPDPRTWP
jgi:hypothetical protein